MTTYAPVRHRPLPRVPIDPRIRARRTAVKRDEGRRRLRRLVMIAMLGVATAALAAALFSPLLDVDVIAVSGVPADRTQAVRDAAGVSRGDPTLLVDTGKVEERIEALPWVASASVSRRLPGTLAVVVTARVAVGWAPDPAGRAAVVDSRGVAIDTLDAPPAGLPLLRRDGAAGPSAGHPAPLLAAQAAAALPAELRATTSGVTVSQGEALVELTGGPVIRLGDGHALDAKVRAAVAILQARSGMPTASIDVRVPTAAAAA